MKFSERNIVQKIEKEDFMNLLWAHDHHFIYDISTGNYYSELGFPYSLWERYLFSFDKIFIVGRVTERKITNLEREKYNLSSGPNVEFLHLPDITSLKGMLKNNNKVKSILKLNLQNVSAVIARLPSRLGMITIEMAKMESLPYAVELVGCPDEALANLKSLKARIYKPYMVKKTKEIVLESTYTLYVTKKYLQNKYPTKGKAIACSNVVLNQYLNPPIKKEFQKKNIENVLIGSIAFLSEYKGIDTTFKICKELEQNNINYKLNILGGGDTQKWLIIAKKIGLDSNNISFFTLPSGNLVLEWLKTLDIYIQPSRTEGLPRGLIEAMSVGCAAVGSNVGGIPELLGKKEIFDKEDYKAMSNRILEILENPSLKTDLEKTNYETAREYSFEKLDIKRKKFWKEYHNSLTK